MSKRVAVQIIDNRIKPEIGWMLEPWASGPPFSIVASFPPICELLLYRLGCPESSQHISVAAPSGTPSYVCACGTLFTYPSTRVPELICDKLNEATLMSMPVWADPVTLSVELSLALVMIVGKLASQLATAIYLPPIIGFILGGVSIQNIVSTGLIKGIGGNGPHSTPFGEMRILALIIVLMRAGITLKPREIAKAGFMTVTLSVLPYFCEWAVMMGIALHLLRWSVIDTGLLTSILAALSPSLVIPGMIRFVGDKLGYTPKAVLTSAPIEVVLAIILFNIFANLEQTTPNPLWPWVSILPLWANIILIPVNICFSCALGLVAGVCIAEYFKLRKATKNSIIERSVGKSNPEFLFVTIVTCYALYSICQPQYIQQSYGVLAVFSTTLTLSERADPVDVEAIKGALAGLWIFVEVILFTTVGINMAFVSTTGPLQGQRGLNSSQLGNVIAILLVGIMGRFGGILMVQLSSYKLLKPHRRDPKYMAAWCVSTLMFQWPKATVQATLGSLPYQLHIIPGAIGLSKGLFILQASAFSVLFMATIGIFLTNVVGKPLAIYLRAQDEKAGFDIDDKPINDKDINDKNILDKDVELSLKTANHSTLATSVSGPRLVASNLSPEEFERLKSAKGVKLLTVIET